MMTGGIIITNRTYSFIIGSDVKKIRRMTNVFDAVNYYKVLTKCGHVGRRHYFDGVFYLIARNAKEAAAVARRMPRVKHDHKDAIVEVVRITRDEYVVGRALKKLNPYYSIKNSSEQKRYPEIKESAHLEPKYEKRADNYDEWFEGRLKKAAESHKSHRRKDKHPVGLLDYIESDDDAA